MIDGSKNANVSWFLNFRVCVFMKSAVIFSFKFFLQLLCIIVAAADFPLFSWQMPYSAGRMLPSKIAYSA